MKEGTRSGWPNGGVPPTAKPVAARASSGGAPGVRTLGHPGELLGSTGWRRT